MMNLSLIRATRLSVESYKSFIQFYLAKMIRKGHPFEETFYIIGKGIDNKEIVKIINKKGNVIYWLMEYEILGGSNTNGNKCHVKTTPVKQVEIEKEHPDKKGVCNIKG